MMLMRVPTTFAALVLLFGMAACLQQPSPHDPSPDPSDDSYVYVRVRSAVALAALDATVAFDASAWTFVRAEASDEVLVASVPSVDSVRIALVSTSDVDGTVAELVFRRIVAGSGDPSLVAFHGFDRASQPIDDPGALEVVTHRPSRPAYSALDAAQAIGASVLRRDVRVHASDPVDLEPWFADFDLGDLTQSGSVNVVDVLLMLHIATGRESAPTPYQRYHSDLDSSGLINVIDVLMGLEKLVDPSRPARLQVAPRVLHLGAATSGVVLIGNSGNVALPQIVVTPPDGITLQEVTSEDGVGRAFRVLASQVSDESIVVDASGAGSVEVVLAIDGYIEIVSTDSLMLTSPGETAQLQAVVYRGDGTLNVDAVVDWSSSDPSVVAVGADGSMLAGQSIGTAVINARAGSLRSSVYAGMVQLGSTSTRVAKHEVLSIEANGPDTSTVTLSKSRVYTVGDIVVSEAGLLSRILELDEEPTFYVAVVETVDLAAAFDRININGVSEALSYAATVSSEGIDVTSDDARIAPFGRFQLVGLDCTTETGASVDVAFEAGEINISYRPTINFEYERNRSNGTEVLRLYVADTPTLYLAPSELTLSAEVEGKIECSRQIAPKLQIPVASLWGIVTVSGSFTPKVGFQAEAQASGSLTITTPSVRAGVDVRAVGLEYNSRNGAWKVLSDTEPFFELGAFETSTGLGFSASVGPFLSLGAGVSIRVLVDAVGIDFLEPKIYGELAMTLDTPLNAAARDYTGPRWNAEVGSTAKVKVEVTGLAAKVLKVFGVRTSYVNDEYQLFLYPIDAYPVPAVETFAAGNSVMFTATVPPRRLSYVGRTVRFSVFRDGGGTAEEVAHGVVDSSGMAVASWFASDADHGQLEVVAHLYDGVFGAISLPYPSALVSFTLPGEDTGGQSIVPSASTCGGVGVGSTCSVTISLEDNDDALYGALFDVITPGFSFQQASVTGLVGQCEFDADPPTGRVAIVCRETFTGSGDLAVIQVVRNSSGPTTFETRRAFITNSMLVERPVSTGGLDVQ